MEPFQWLGADLNAMLEDSRLEYVTKDPARNTKNWNQIKNALKVYTLMLALVSAANKVHTDKYSLHFLGGNSLDELHVPGVLHGMRTVTERVLRSEWRDD